MRVDILSREYPPEVYGGAGVHVAELAAAFRARDDVDLRVRCFGDSRDEEGTTGYLTPVELADASAAIRTLATDLTMIDDCAGADVVHSHTWYANHAGHLGSLLHGVPHVVTAHSLEPLRPWKAEQLGGGYAISSWVERQAYENAARVIAVSDAMRADVLRCYPSIDPDAVAVVRNGIDTDDWAPHPDRARVRALGADPDLPSIVYVGRVTRQKGLPHLLRAARLLPRDTQLVLCAGAADTREVEREVEALVAELRATHDRIVWIPQLLARHDVVAMLSAATVFVCPSVYEPLGIVNLEAMACETAVVATATGGIPEVVADGETGWLVPIEQLDDGTGAPVDPTAFERDLAAVLADALSDPERATAYGKAGRRRAYELFSWEAVAEQTLDVYRGVLSA
ncbi:glycogen synthase [Solicola gregarius]|uniref:Glycogen synthase n=1 Tax=Solicola gregarius TaxID=2908642 RepID=A0AA46TKV9_9ACTN|nr:glycogen synthase [Solicola gregarius]UYM07177.1 glycogen synthase [Solicola gregarius]